MDKDMRFDWYARRRTMTFRPLVQVVAERIDQGRSKRGVKPEQLDKIRLKERSTLHLILHSLYCAYFTVPKGTVRVSLPLTAGFYTHSDFSYRVIDRIHNQLLQLGWIDSEKGKEGRGYTRIWAIGELSLKFDNIGLTWFEQVLNPREELVILRDYKSESSKKKIDVKLPEDDPKVEEYRNLLFKYNHFLSQHCLALNLEDVQLISLAQGMAENSNEENSKKTWLSGDESQQIAYLDFSRIQLVRIFARGSLEKGGRFYRGWWQSLPSRYRPFITIDGYRTCEIDFSGMSIYIMYSEEGVQFPHDRDPYDIGLEDWQGDKDPRRKLIKRFFNAKINDETGKFRLTSQEYQQLGITHKELMERILEVHSPISHYLTTGVGLDTQFIDSQIASYIMDEMVDRNIVVLPIHDSFIVREGYESELREVMLEAFNFFTQKKGQVTTDYSRLPEHFNMTDEEFEQETLQLKEDPSAGIVSIEDIAESIIEQRSSIMDGYVASWEGWLRG